MILCVTFLRGVGIFGELPTSAQVPARSSPEGGGSMDSVDSVDASDNSKAEIVCHDHRVPLLHMHKRHSVSLYIYMVSL